MQPVHYSESRCPQRIVGDEDGDRRFPAISLDMARWYTDNDDTYFASRPLLHAQVMRGNTHTLLPRLASPPASDAAVGEPLSIQLIPPRAPPLTGMTWPVT